MQAVPIAIIVGIDVYYYYYYYYYVVVYIATYLRTLMNLGEFLQEYPDTLGCLTQNTSGSIERLFIPLYMFCENETKIQTLQNMKCFLSLFLEYLGSVDT